MLLGMFSGLPYTIVAVVNFDGAVAKRCVEKMGYDAVILGGYYRSVFFTDKTGL